MSIYPSIPSQLLLTPKETDLIMPFCSHYRAVMQMVTNDVLNDELNKTFKDLCINENGLQRAIRIADKHIYESWYSTFPSVSTLISHTPKSYERPFYLTSDSPNEAKEIPPENWQDFYFSFHAPSINTREYYSDLRNSLKLSREYRYIDYEIIYTLLSIVEVFGSPTQGEEITTTKMRSFFHSPISKAYREQTLIGTWGDIGGHLTVGDKTKIFAKITDKDEKPVSLPPLYIAIQTAIGNLIEEANNALPIIVTPAQIARKVFMQSSDFEVSKDDIETIIQAMDTMRHYDAYIDFSQQLTDHTNIKKQNDYDYTEGVEAFGVEQGDLIYAKKIAAGKRATGEAPITWKGNEVKLAYKIYEIPAFYHYSHVVRQIAEIDNRLISSSCDAKKLLGEKSKQKKTGLRESALEISIISNIKYITSMIERYPNLSTPARTLSFSDLFDQEELNAMTPAKRRTRIKYITQYLDFLKENGEITDYEIVSGLHNKVTGFVINPKRRTKRSQTKK